MNTTVRDTKKTINYFDERSPETRPPCSLTRSVWNETQTQMNFAHGGAAGFMETEG